MYKNEISKPLWLSNVIDETDPPNMKANTHCSDCLGNYTDTYVSEWQIIIERKYHLLILSKLFHWRVLISGRQHICIFR